ncbi:MAG: N-acetyltransferase family protein [Vulcanimicrobiaceae bacterium]
MAAITIVRATPEHLSDVLPLVAGYRDFYKQRTDPERELTFIEAHLRDGTGVMFLASLDERPCGFVQLFPMHSTVHLGRGWILEDLFVAPAARRNGIGEALMTHALKFAELDGAVGMFLETALDNETAQALYERMGWTREARFLKYNAPL